MDGNIPNNYNYNVFPYFFDIIFQSSREGALSINVLIVEDEPIPAEYLKSIIEHVECFKVVDIVDNEDDTIDAIHKYNVDIIFMDIMIKGSKSGAEVALKIRSLKDNILIIFLTAYSEKEMIDYAVDADAFAYLLKPYRPDEITATLELAKKRLNKTKEPVVEEDSIKLIDNYYFNKHQNRLYLDKNEIKLTLKEQDLLALLASNLPGLVDTKTILEKLNISELSLRSLLYRFRSKTNKDLILSIKGVGYKLSTI